MRRAQAFGGSSPSASVPIGRRKPRSFLVKGRGFLRVCWNLLRLRTRAPPLVFRAESTDIGQPAGGADILGPSACSDRSNLSATRGGSRSSHSQTSNTAKPRARNALTDRASLDLFSATFCAQNARFCAGR